MKNFIVRTFSDYSDIWIQRSYPSQCWQKSLHPKWTVLSGRRVSILHRHVLALLGPPQSRRSEGASGGIHAGGSLCQMLRGRVLMFRALGCRCRWIQNTESLHSFLFCFIFSSKALSYFIRWGTQGPDPVSVWGGKRKKRWGNPGKYPNLSANPCSFPCMSVSIASCARQIPAPKNRTQNNHF